MDRPLRIWALLGHRAGDNNQVLALAEALGGKVEIKKLSYNWRRFLPMRWLNGSLAALRPESRGLLAGAWPDLVIGIGRRSVPVSLWIRKQATDECRIVQLGSPKQDPDLIDLVITTPQYPVPDRSNVLRLPIALSRYAASSSPSPQVRDILAAYEYPRRLVLLGGPTLFWQLRVQDVIDALTFLLVQAEQEGGSVLVLTSRRTPAKVRKAAERALASARIPAALAEGEGWPPYRQLLTSADRVYVSADSVSMISEAVAAGKPVGLVPVRHTVAGAVWMSIMDWFRPGQPVFPRDLRRFWKELRGRGLAGTTAAPAAGEVDVLTPALDRVRALLVSS